VTSPPGVSQSPIQSFACLIKTTRDRKKGKPFVYFVSGWLPASVSASAHCKPISANAKRQRQSSTPLIVRKRQRRKSPETKRGDSRPETVHALHDRCAATLGKRLMLNGKNHGRFLVCLVCWPSTSVLSKRRSSLESENDVAERCIITSHAQRMLMR